MAKKPDKTHPADQPAKAHTRNLIPKRYTVDEATIAGLETIQAEVPDVMSDSAALRYAVRETVERLLARKERKPPSRGKP